MIETIEQLKEKVNLLEKQNEIIINNCVDVLRDSLCDKHLEQIRNISFDDNCNLVKGVCLLCLKEEERRKNE